MTKKLKKHRPTRYMTLTGGGTLTFGWRCRCGVPSRRFKLKEARERDLADHLQ